MGVVLAPANVWFKRLLVLGEVEAGSFALHLGRGRNGGAAVGMRLRRNGMNSSWEDKRGGMEPTFRGSGDQRLKTFLLLRS